MKLSYRSRKWLRRTLITLLTILIAGLLGWLSWVTWLGRYVVYTRDEGAVLDMNLPPMSMEGNHIEPTTQETVSIYYNEGDSAINTSTELTQVLGYYIEPEALEKDIDGVKKQISALPTGTPVMITLKNIYGNFLYSSDVSSARSDAVSIEKVDELIAYLDKSGMYTVAAVPALRDRNYGLNHTNDGIPDVAYKGGALWMDDEGCYWLNPGSQGTVSYLMQVATEIKGLGFDEVVFTEYYVPQNDRVMFDGDRAETLTAAAKSLLTACSTEKFAVSFVGKGDWKIPEGRSRLYMEGVDPMDVEKMAMASQMKDPKIQVVFLTDLHDTRFEEYGVMRPLSAAH